MLQIIENKIIPHDSPMYLLTMHEISIGLINALEFRATYYKGRLRKQFTNYDFTSITSLRCSYVLVSNETFLVQFYVEF